MSLTFKLHKTEGFARRAEIHLNHGVVQTPVFMPVGTYGTVKAMSPLELNEIGTQILLGNTFHLWLRPGLEVIAEHGGLHGFMGWEKPIRTPAASRSSLWANCAKLPKKACVLLLRSTANVSS